MLEDILDTPVSPELLPAVQGEISQRTEDLVGPYELHDFFLYYSVRWGFTPGKPVPMTKPPSALVMSINTCVRSLAWLFS